MRKHKSAQHMVYPLHYESNYSFYRLNFRIKLKSQNFLNKFSNRCFFYIPPGHCQPEKVFTMKSHKRNSRSALEISYPQFVTKNNNSHHQQNQRNNSHGDISSPISPSLSPPKGFHSRFPKCTPCLKSKNENKIQAQQQTFNKQRRQSLQYIYQTRQQQPDKYGNNRTTRQINSNNTGVPVVERRYSYDQFGRLMQQASASSPHSGQFKN